MPRSCWQLMIGPFFPNPNWEKSSDVTYFDSIEIFWPPPISNPSLVVGPLLIKAVWCCRRCEWYAWNHSWSFALEEALISSIFRSLLGYCLIALQVIFAVGHRLHPITLFVWTYVEIFDLKMVYVSHKLLYAIGMIQQHFFFNWNQIIHIVWVCILFDKFR